MTTLAAGATATVTVTDDGFINVSTNGGLASISVTPTGGSATSYNIGPLPTRRKFGPYGEGATATITNLTAALDYDISADSTRLTEAQAAAVAALVSAGTLTIFRPTVVPTIGGTATPTITMNAGAGNTISGARATINPDTDTIGAQRLLTVTDYTHAIPALGRTLVIQSEVDITSLHLVGLSSSTTYAGAAFVIGTAETDLSDAIANDARFDFSAADDVRTVVIVLQQGATAQTALAQVTGYSHTGG